MPKNPIISHSAKIKICTFSNLRLRPSGWPRHPHTHTHTHTKQVKTICMELFWDHFKSTFDLRKRKLTMLAFKTNLAHPHANLNWAQFQKAQVTPYKTRYAFSCLPPGQHWWFQSRASLGIARVQLCLLLLMMKINIYWWIQQSPVGADRNRCGGGVLILISKIFIHKSFLEVTMNWNYSLYQ